MTRLSRVLRTGCALLLSVGCAASCVVAGTDGYGGGGVSYVGTYYEPFGYEYGGWRSGYAVGPARSGAPRYQGHDSRGDRDVRGKGGYRQASPGRPMPSIPGRPRH